MVLTKEQIETLGFLIGFNPQHPQPADADQRPHAETHAHTHAFTHPAAANI